MSKKKTPKIKKAIVKKNNPSLIPFDVDEPFLKALLKTIPFAIDVVAKDGEILYASDLIQDAHGTNVNGKKCWDVYRDDKKQCINCPLSKPIKIGETKTVLSEGVFGGRIFQISHTGMMFKGKKCVLEVFEDVTERVVYERELDASEKFLAAEKRKLEQVLDIDTKLNSIHKLNQLVDFVVEKSCEILEADKCSLMLFDKDTQEVLIRGSVGIDEEVVKTARIKVGEQIAGFVAGRGEPLLVTDIESDELVGKKNRKTYKSKSFMSVPIIIEKKLVGIVNVSDKRSSSRKKVIHNQDDVFNETDLKILTMVVNQAAVAIENANYYRKLEFLSTTDPLTSLYNHRHFIRSLDREIHVARRYNKALSLLLIDVDDFKPYNDTFGHLEGDRLLKRVAKMFNENLRVVDIVCRYAGDEFVIILPETTLSQSKIVAQKILKQVDLLKMKRPVTMSLGAAQLNEFMGRRDFILKADQALYQAKRAGKNQICD